MVATVFVVSLGFMFLLDTVDSSYAEHASTLAAPLFILIRLTCRDQCCGFVRYAMCLTTAATCRERLWQ